MTDNEIRETCALLILAGGKSSRMGQPKAWLPFGDELLLPRIVRLLVEVVARNVGHRGGEGTVEDPAHRTRVNAAEFVGHRLGQHGVHVDQGGHSSKGVSITTRRRAPPNRPS